MTVKQKLIAIFIIPLVLIIYFSANKAYEYYSLEQQALEVQTYIALSTKISAIVHETQKERGMTAGFIGSKGKKFANKLPNQRKLTDSRIAQLESFLKGKEYSQQIQNRIDMIKSRFKTMISIRQKVSNLNISAKEAIGFYTKTNSIVLNTIALTAKITKSAKFSKQLVSYTNFLMSKERAGIERAVLTNVFVKGYFATGDFNKFHKLVIEQDAFLKSFEITALKKDKEFFAQLQKDSSFAEVEEYRQIAFSKEEKTRVITEISLLMGYTNFIHNFKNYLLRGQDKYRGRAIENYREIVKLADKYLSLGKNTTIENSNIQIIKDVLGQYKDALKIIQRRFERAEQKRKVMDIMKMDRLVQIDDAPAKNAIDNILYNIHGAEADAWFATITRKINKLKEMEDFLTQNLVKESKNAEEYANGETIFYIVVAIIIIMVFMIFTILSIRFLIDHTLHNTFNIIKNNTDTIKDVSNQSLQSANQLAHNAADQASVVEELSAMTEETSANNLANQNTVNELKDIAEKTKNSAEFGYSHIESLDESMKKIDESSENISSILKTIDEIAFQTNLLSLNAAVEAARAGEHGLGFAVVAEEVRALASRSAQNAKETSNIIESSRTEVQNGTKIAIDTNESFKEILGNISQTNELIQSVVNSIYESTQSIEQISSSIHSLNQSAMEVASNSDDVANNSKETSCSVKVLNDEIDSIIKTIG
jgi:methyl-accepting chemotaxis protein